jgi:two-component system LytT family response regulator
MRTIIIEDEQLTRKMIANMVKANGNLEYIGEASTVAEGLVLINATQPDLILMDIQLNDGTGFDILEKINSKAKVVFITAYQEYAIKALKIGAVDYILKPIDSSEFDEAILKAQKDTTSHEQLAEVKMALNGTFDKLILKTIEGIHIVKIADILYLQSNGSYTHFYLSQNRSIVVSKNIKEYENMLPDNQFARCHNSFLVNLNEVMQIDRGNNLILSNNVEIPVSGRKKEQILELLTKKT